MLLRLKAANLAEEGRWNDALRWWNGRRPLYNIGLAVAGLIAFVLYAIAFDRLASKDSELEITAFTIAFQACGYALCMLIANALFFLGPIVEVVIQPVALARYRVLAFGAGFIGSVCLPFSAPLLVVLISVSAR